MTILQSLRFLFLIRILGRDMNFEGVEELLVSSIYAYIYLFIQAILFLKLFKYLHLYLKN